VLDLKKNFGKRLRYLRRDRDVTQERLAELIGRSVNFVSMMEKGEAAPSFETLERLAEVLNVEVMEFFRFDSK
jgi:transcriptional regulator with XRE-family HTH domain